VLSIVLSAPRLVIVASDAPEWRPFIYAKRAENLVLVARLVALAHFYRFALLEILGLVAFPRGSFWAPMNFLYLPGHRFLRVSRRTLPMMALALVGNSELAATSRYASKVPFTVTIVMLSRFFDMVRGLFRRC